ncbi:MAG: MFS transporter [Dermatophilaceae bacterium]
MLRRLGFPDASRHRALVAGIGIDALGSGVFMPISVLYFLRTTNVDLAEIGLALGIAGAVAIPFILVSGALVDRFGARTLLLTSNLVQAAGYAGYVFARELWAIVAVSALAAVGQSAFWSSYSPMVAAATEPGEREVWFGFLGALRNIGFAVGGVLASAVMQIDSAVAYRAMVLVNAASYLLAFLVLLGVRTGGRVVADMPNGGEGAGGAWRLVLRDRAYLLLVASNVSYALCTISLVVAMPVYTLATLRLPGWVSGAILTANTILVGVGQGLVVRAMDGHRRRDIIVTGQMTYAAGFVAVAACGWLPRWVAVAGIFVAVVVYTLGELLSGPPLSAVAVEAAPEALRGRYLAAYQLSWNAANIAAPVVLLGLLAHDRVSVWVFLVAVAVAGGALVAACARRMPAATIRVTSAPSP